MWSGATVVRSRFQRCSARKVPRAGNTSTRLSETQHQINNRTHPNADGIDIGASEIVAAGPPDRCDEIVRTFTPFTSWLRDLRDWLKECGVTTVAMKDRATRPFAKNHFRNPHKRQLRPFESPITRESHAPHQLPNPDTRTLEGLEMAMNCGRDGKVFRRLNAIHLLLTGADYDSVLRNSRASERMLRLWISRFNAQGIDGLIYRPRPGRLGKLDAAKIQSDILPFVDDPSLAGETHWTGVKLCGWLLEEKRIALSYRTPVRHLHEHHDVRKIPRPMPEPPDRDAWEDQREIFAFELLEMLENPACEVFFGDEAGFEGDPRPR